MDINNFTKSIIFDSRQTVELGHAAEIVRAPLFKHDPGDNGRLFSIVSIKDFPVAGYLEKPAKTIKLVESAARASRFTVSPFDLLITIVGTIGLITIVPESVPDNWIPATNMFRVRYPERRRENSIALYAFFKSTAGTAAIGSLIHGRTIPLVAKGPFSAIRVPVANSTIVQATSMLWEREQELFAESQRELSESQQIFEDYLSTRGQSILA